MKPRTPEIPSLFFLPGNPEHRGIVGAVGGRRPSTALLSPDLDAEHDGGDGNLFRDEHLMRPRGHWQPTPPWVATCYAAINNRRTTSPTREPG